MSLNQRIEDMTMEKYSFLPDMAASTEVPDKGILSQTIVNNEDVRVVVFGFAAGEELSEHTASVPAMIEIVAGEAEVKLGDDHHEASAGFWAYMPAKLPHSIRAKAPLKMLLLMLKK